MKIIYFFIGFLLTYSNLTAQKKITEKYNVSNFNKANIHLKFAKTIELKSWHKKDIVIEAEININKNKDNNLFSLKNNTKNNILSIYSDYGTLFKQHQKGVTITHNGNSSNSYNYGAQHNEVIINYVIYVPKNIDLKVKSISGNVKSTEYKSPLTLDLVSGNITLKKLSKKMNLKTVSGDIDLYVSNAKFKAKTVTGTIYSNLNIDFDFDFNKKNNYSNTVKGKTGKPNNSLVLNTVSGDIMLRK